MPLEILSPLSRSMTSIQTHSIKRDLVRKTETIQSVSRKGFNLGNWRLTKLLRRLKKQNLGKISLVFKKSGITRVSENYHWWPQLTATPKQTIFRTPKAIARSHICYLSMPLSLHAATTGAITTSLHKGLLQAQNKAELSYQGFWRI